MPWDYWEENWETNGLKKGAQEWMVRYVGVWHRGNSISLLLSWIHLGENEVEEKRKGKGKLYDLSTKNEGDSCATEIQYKV